MGRLVRSLVSTGLVATFALFAVHATIGDARAAPSTNDGGEGGSLPACIHVTANARYVPFGYNHIVDVTNGCSKLAACRVWTNVNPQPITVEVAPGLSSEVITFVGSPSQTFTPYVTCALK